MNPPSENLLFAPLAFDLREMTFEEAAIFEAWEKNERPYPWTAAQFLETRETNGKWVFALGEDPVCAFIVIQHLGPEAYVENVMSNPLHRRLGHGRKIMEKALKWVQANGAERALLDVEENNIPARTLYQSLGFQEKNRRSKGYPGGESAILFAIHFK